MNNLQTIIIDTNKGTYIGRFIEEENTNITLEYPCLVTESYINDNTLAKIIEPSIKFVTKSKFMKINIESISIPTKEIEHLYYKLIFKEMNLNLRENEVYSIQ